MTPVGVGSCRCTYYSKRGRRKRVWEGGDDEFIKSEFIGLAVLFNFSEAGCLEYVHIKTFISSSVQFRLHVSSNFPLPLPFRRSGGPLVCCAV